MADHRRAERGLLADEPFESVLPERCYEPDGHLLVVILEIQHDAVKETDLVGAGLCVDHNGGGEHLLEIADAAHILALLGLGSLILKIFTQIAERAGNLHILEDLRHEHFLALAELLAHFLHINGSQFVVHGVYLAFFPLKHRRMLSFVGKRNGVVSL